MFLAHFGLDREPFALGCDGRSVYFGPTNRDAVSALYLAVKQGAGGGLLIGPAGSGKTTLLRHLEVRLRPQVEVALLEYPYRSRSDVLADVLDRLGLPLAGGEFERMRRVRERLIALQRRDSGLLLAFDEAQAMSEEALEQARLLGAARFNEGLPVEIVLAGDESFSAMLYRPGMEALSGRLNVRVNLKPLTMGEVGPYIEQRLAGAGARRPLFTPEAVEEIARSSGGLPRAINRLCLRALTLAWLDDRAEVDAAAAREAVGDGPSGIRHAAAIDS